VSLENWLREEFKTIEERVRYILENYPATRNDDFYLCLIYIRLFCPELSKYIKFIPWEVFKNARISFESITRARRKIQERGEYLPTDPKVLRRRRKLEKAYRNVMPTV